MREKKGRKKKKEYISSNKIRHGNLMMILGNNLWERESRSESGKERIKGVKEDARQQKCRKEKVDRTEGT